MEQESNSGKNFVRAVLPWLVAAVALALYLCTLNHWVSVYNIDTVAKISGWNWVPDLHAPLFYVVTFPFRLLPPHLLPLALNVFTAVCAALAIALLARSVALLPHNKTNQQRQRIRERGALLNIRPAWLPPVLAGIVCGLQMTFWEHATNASGEMLDLLLFAYVLRCLLEFRLDHQQKWLSRAAVIYGLGMANNWAMIGFFPLFIAALVWLKGFKFFDLQFLTRMALLGLAGLSLYLLLPITQYFSNSVSLTFWQALKGNLIGQKNILLYFPRKTFLLLSLTSLLPVLVMSIRWPSNFGDPSPLGVALTNFVLHIAHALFLVACIWIMFDPAFSPRQKAPLIPFLTFYYLAALSIGYFSGYFLLVFSGLPQANRRRSPKWQKYVNATVTSCVWILFLFATAGLFCKNFPLVRINNNSSLAQYASLLTEQIPSNAAILSDDMIHLRLAEAALARSGHAREYIALDTQALKWPQYHNYLHNRYGTNWPEVVDPKREKFYADLEMVNLVSYLAQQRPVYYLHSSFGYYFEYFYPVPHGLAYELKKYPQNQVVPPPLTEAEIAENDRFWQKTKADILPSILENLGTPERGTNYTFRDYFFDALHLKAEPIITPTFLGLLYSHPVNYWGVQLERAGKLEAAGNDFHLAQKLNPNNVVAGINEQFNQRLQAGLPPKMEINSSMEDRFGRYNSWSQVIAQNGPFDDPAVCLEESRIFAEGGLVRQAIILLTRIVQLVPQDLTAHIRLAQLYAQIGLADSALELTREIRQNPETYTLNSTNQTELLTVDSVALFSQNKNDEAQGLLRTALNENPDNSYLLTSALRVAMRFGSYSNALTAANGLLRISPDDATLLVAKGFIQMQLHQYSAAIVSFDRVLTLQTNNDTALLDRAICYLQADKFDEAKADYDKLQKIYPNQFQIDYGLGEIAYRRHQTNEAIQNYQAYITHAGTNTAEAQMILGRLKELKGESP